MTTLERETEIATMSLHKLHEWDAALAQQFMIEEIGMDKEELESHGVNRVRKATEIDWCVDKDEDDYEEIIAILPKEVDIPCDVLDDDIADYLSDEYNFLVNYYNVEEDEF